MDSKSLNNDEITYDACLRMYPHHLVKHDSMYFYPISYCTVVSCLQVSLLNEIHFSKSKAQNLIIFSFLHNTYNIVIAQKGLLK